MLSSFLVGCGQISETRVVKLAHGLDVKHAVHLSMLKMGEDLKEISGGKMVLEIYPNQQLGTERECLELIQIGSLDMTKVSVGVFFRTAIFLRRFRYRRTGWSCRRRGVSCKAVKRRRG